MKKTLHSKSMAAFLMASSALSLIGCDRPGGEIGPNTENPLLSGETVQEKIFPEGPLQNSTVIKGSNLEENGSYRATGELIIDGNVPKGVSITVNNGKLYIKVCTVKEHIMVSISDSGKGIPKDEIDEIFKPFFI